MTRNRPPAPLATAAPFFTAADHQRVLETGPDVPAQPPRVPLPLDGVGISSKTVWLRLPQGRIPMTATLEVDLAANRRGIHMSRMEEAVSRLADVEFGDPAAYGAALCQEVVAGQEGEGGRVALTGQLPRSLSTPVSNRTSQDTVAVEATCEMTGGTMTIRRAVAIHHLTACPCTQAYLAAGLPAAAEGPCPLPTHSQRSRTRLALTLPAEVDLSYDEICQVLAAALHPGMDLLKRPDEAELVLSAHRHPQFAEDAVREVAAACHRRFGHRLPPDTVVAVDSLSFESIHLHDVCCRLETTLGRLAHSLGATGS